MEQKPVGSSIIVSAAVCGYGGFNYHRTDYGHGRRLGPYRELSKAFYGSAATGIYWAKMTGPVQSSTNPVNGIPGGEIATFCTHDKMAGGSDARFDQIYNNSPTANEYQDRILSITGMNATHLSEMRYAIALGITNKLMDTQSAYWAYIHLRRPDKFGEENAYDLSTGNRKTYWFGSKPGSYDGLTVPSPARGLFPRR